MSSTVNPQCLQYFVGSPSYSYTSFMTPSPISSGQAVPSPTSFGK